MSWLPSQTGQQPNALGRSSPTALKLHTERGVDVIEIKASHGWTSLSIAGIPALVTDHSPRSKGAIGSADARSGVTDGFTRLI